MVVVDHRVRHSKVVVEQVAIGPMIVARLKFVIKFVVEPPPWSKFVKSLIRLLGLLHLSQ